SFVGSVRCVDAPGRGLHAAISETLLEITEQPNSAAPWSAPATGAAVKNGTIFFHKITKNASRPPPFLPTPSSLRKKLCIFLF
ncbi:hypothetical protein, partial [Pseudomonas aeruginosa]|uniref:hypothetical protein n=1 Tax=Pseudomonas aeruginosa TaxID=287 RepID=UPI003CC631F2